MPKKILIIAGEPSGDVYGAALVSAVRKIRPDAAFSGIGGAGMKEAGVEILFPMDELAIIGVLEIFPKLRVIKNAFDSLRKRIDEERFDLAVLVNYPGFNLRLAKILKSKGIPVVFYSSPQVWAWGRWRVKTIKKFVDKMIVLLKFEEGFYRRYGVSAEFVGHPLVDIVKPQGTLGAHKNGRVVSLVPGSRKSEIKNMFPAMLKAAKIIHSKCPDARFIVTKHPSIPYEVYERCIKRSSLPLEVIDGKIYDCLSISDLAIVVSGSVTLEAAILKTPMIITNRLSFINGLLYLLFVRLKNVGLVNIIAQKNIMPELLQYLATPSRIAKEALDILSDRHRYETLKASLESVKSLIGAPGASERAAAIIAGLL